MIKTFKLTTPDGLKLQGRHWSIKKPQAVFCLVHGMGEHTERFDNLGAFLQEHAIAMIGLDRRGHGQSEGKRGHVPSYDNLRWEVDAIIKESEKMYPSCPRILYGHSMGGNIVLENLFFHDPDVKAVIATSPWIRLANPPAQIVMKAAQVLSKVMGSFTIPSGLDAQGISTLPAEVERYKNDQWVHDKISFSTFSLMNEAAQKIDAFAGKVKKPLLICQGVADPIIDVEGARALAKRLSGPFNYREWEGVAHELQHDKVEKELFELVLEWSKVYFE